MITRYATRVEHVLLSSCIVLHRLSLLGSRWIQWWDAATKRGTTFQLSYLENSDFFQLRVRSFGDDFGQNRAWNDDKKKAKKTTLTRAFGSAYFDASLSLIYFARFRLNSTCSPILILIRTLSLSAQVEQLETCLAHSLRRRSSMWIAIKQATLEAKQVLGLFAGLCWWRAWKKRRGQSEAGCANFKRSNACDSVIWRDRWLTGGSTFKLVTSN